MLHQGWRVPDKVFWALALLVTALTWASVLYLYRFLPSPIPTHLNLAGQPDAWSPKTWTTVFLPVLIQTGLVALLGWVYRHPQYSHIPSSLAIGLFPEPWRTKIIMLMRHLLVMVTVIISLLFAYLTQGMMAMAFNQPFGISAWVLAGLVLLLLVIVVVYTRWLYRWSKQAVAAAHANRPD